MHDPFDEEHQTPLTFDTPVRPQHLRETYRESGKASRRETQWKAGDQFGEFRLGRLLGQGSSGVVFEAFHAESRSSEGQDFDRMTRCALKILVPESPDDLVRNKVGFRHMLKVHNKHLMRVNQVHRVGEHVALSMELIEGRTFAKEVNELRKLDSFVACERIQELLRHYALALSVMHANCFIHRDIKPQNLMVDSEGNGRLIDYGLVGEINPESDPSGIRPYLAGTPQYMAPEVWSEQSYLPAGDIYSLGKVIYEALRVISGNKRLATQTPSEFENAKNLHPPSKEWGTSVPEILIETCTEMLETNPGDRPTAFQVARMGQTTASTLQLPSDYKLYGRSQELSCIFEWLDGVLKGQCGRLHISGPSGIGKSRIIEAVTRQLASRRWLHVFSARCQLREDQPMQAFDQICDALATRYAKEDLGDLEVDPGSAAILHQAFPVLEKVVKASRHLPPFGSVPARLDALEAAARVARKILETGPLILVIDDAQWADQDSLNVLDRLQAERASSLAIITLSRTDDDLQQLPADLHMRLGPLSSDDSRIMLRQAADRWSVNVSESTIESLARITDGTPFRLDEFADEFRPGGVFAEGDSGIRSYPTETLVDGLLEQRLGRLSHDARRLLALIAVAGGSVSKDEIVALKNVGCVKASAIEELYGNRFVQADESHDKSVRILHDRLADRLVRELSNEERVEANRLWSEVLILNASKPFQAARIAGHLFEAGEIESAIVYADRAVAEAEQRYAMTEAARWHERVIPHVVGDAKVDRIRQTARCYDQADLPIKAAEYYTQLAEWVVGQELIDSELRALALLIRSGRTQNVRQSILRIAKQLDLPRPKGTVRALLSLMTKSLRLRVLQTFRGGRELTVPANTPVDQSLRLCLELSRPLCMLDNLYGAELALSGSIRALHTGSRAQQLRSDIAVAVYGSYEPGAARQRSELALTDLLARAEALGDPKALGDCHGAIAATHVLALRWASVVEPSKISLKAYGECREGQSFEIAHTQFHLLIAYMHLGRIGDLQTLSQVMYDSSITRNDLLARLMACSGAGACGWLAGHRFSEFDASRSEIRSELKREGIQFVDFAEFMSTQFRLIYEERWDEAETNFENSEKFITKMPCSGIQICRADWFEFQSLVLLNQFDRHPTKSTFRRAELLIRKLRKEKVAHCDTIADLHEGYLFRLANQPAKARHLFSSAERKATQLGLVPISLAASDAIELLTSTSCLNRLHQFLRSEGVVRPERFANLYAVQPKSASQSSRGSVKS